VTVHAARRRLEEALDALLDALEDGSGCEERFRAASAAAHCAFQAEEPLLAAWAEDFPGLVAKMRGQHEEAGELAAAVEDSFAGGASAGERARLLRAFHAIAQHNVIEEDRELFSRLPPPAPDPGSGTD
jgi:hypothetical protein